MSCWEAALDYARQGFFVFPLHNTDEAGQCSCGRADCGSAGKHPRTPRGFHDASCDETQIIGWWTAHPEANVGIATGASGLVVIDVDVKDGQPGKEKWLNLVAAFRVEYGIDLRDTTIVETPTGGLHIYFRAGEYHKIPCSAGRLDKGIDVRALGGYVVAPPSVIAGVSYQHLDGYGLKRLAHLPEALAEGLIACSSASPNSRSSAEGAIPQGERNDALFRGACAMRRRGHTEHEILATMRATNTRCEPPLSEAELINIVASAMKYEPAGAAKEAKEAKEVGGPGVQWPTSLGPPAFHGPLGELVGVLAPRNEADPVGLLINALVGFGSVLGSEACISVGSDRHPPRLFALLVGDTSKARKGMSWNPIYDVLVQIDATWGERVVDGLASGEGLIWHVRDPISQMVKKKVDGETTYEEELADPGVSDKRLCIGEGEFARVLQVMSRPDNTLSAVIRNAWDKGDLRTLTRNSPARSSGAHISIVGHITTDELRLKLTSNEAGNGFANRFLFACVRRSKCLPYGGRPDPGELTPIVAALNEARQFASTVKDTVGEIHWAADADERWVEVYPELSEGKPGLVGALTARAEAQVLRLALIYALADCSEVIRRVHLEAALELWRYCEESALYIFGARSGNEVADTIIAELRKQPEGLSRTEISELFKRHKSAAQIDDALRLLASIGRARCKPEQTEGRSREVWHAL